MPPSPGQPYLASPGLRFSIGDPDATAGTDAFNGVIFLEAGVPVSSIVDAAVDFDIKVFYKTALGGADYILPAAFSTDFHIHEVDSGATVAGSPFAGGPLVLGDIPAGAALAAGIDEVNWASSTVTIPALTLAPDTAYRVTIEGDDLATLVFVVHDFTSLRTT
jgi:hypothetical protein